MIIKHDSISRGSCFCEKYIYYKNKFKTKRNEKKLIRNTLCIMYTSLILSLNLAINLSPTLYHSLPLCNYSLNVCASSHSLLSPNPPTLSLSLSLSLSLNLLNLVVLSLTIYISHFCYGPLAFYMYVILSTTLFQKALHIFTYISILLIYVYCIVLL